MSRQLNPLEKEVPYTHSTGGWVHPRTGLESVEKSTYRDSNFDPLAVQPAGNRYTDFSNPPLSTEAIVSHLLMQLGRIFAT
jgi:hypothetical protein